MKHWSERFEKLSPCPEALEWARTQDTYEAAWANCERGDWMMWDLAHKCGEIGSPMHRQVVLVACAHARLALPYVPEYESRPLEAILTAEAWARREKGITLEQVRAAAGAAYAAGAVGDAARAAYAAARAAVAAGDAARAAYAAAGAAILRECAAIVRQHFPEPPTYMRVKEKDA